MLAQLPFLATHFYTGPLVAPLGGADISWLVGLAVPAVLYWLAARRDTARTVAPGPRQEEPSPAGSGG